MSAELVLKAPLEEDVLVTKADLQRLLKNKKVVYGIDEGKLLRIAQDPHGVSYPVIIAQGTPAQAGHDAYLVNEIKQKDKREKFHFRNVITIPSVKNGQLLASVIPATPGTNGTDVTGKILKAKPGRPLRTRPGKNVIFHLEQFFATTDGQVSITERAIHVNPVYEVRGDLDMKTGNIDFIGNVVIHGNVPTGYTIKAGGDIKIFGLVEGASLQANGSIYISGGITAEGRGQVVAQSNVQAAYLNQAHVIAGGDIFITRSVMHSKIEAKGSICCEQGLIIGGEIKSHSHIIAKEIGNHLFTKTCLLIVDTSIAEKEHSLKKKINELKENINKLKMIVEKVERLKQAVSLSAEQERLLTKQKSAIKQLKEQLAEQEDELHDVEFLKKEKETPTICVQQIMFPNTHMRFGKYAKVIRKEHRNVKFWYDEGEIHFTSYI